MTENASDVTPESDSGGSKVSLLQEDEQRSEVIGQVKGTQLSVDEMSASPVSVSERQVKSGRNGESENKLAGKQAGGCDIRSHGRSYVLASREEIALNQNDVTHKGTDEGTNKRALSVNKTDDDDVTDSGIHLGTNQSDTVVSNILIHLPDGSTKTKSVGDSVKLQPSPTTAIPDAKLSTSSSSSEIGAGKVSAAATISSDKDTRTLLSPKDDHRQIQDKSDTLVQDQLQQGSLTLDLRHEGGRRLTTEDIYDKYGSWHNQPVKDGVKPLEEIPDHNVQQTVIREVPETEAQAEPFHAETLPYTDMWAHLPSPGVIQSLSLSSNHVWTTDKDEHIYYSSLSGPGLSWHKISVSGKQIAVSPNGSILWRVHRNKAYAATKITAKKPDGTKWIEAVRDVAFIALDNTMCW